MLCIGELGYFFFLFFNETRSQNRPLLAVCVSRRLVRGSPPGQVPNIHCNWSVVSRPFLSIYFFFHLPSIPIFFQLYGRV